MRLRPFTYLKDETGAVTVDWTVLSAAAVSMSLATVGILNGGIEDLVSNLEAELRSQQLSDSFVDFTPVHFEPMYEHGLVTNEIMGQYFEVADELMNQQIIDALEYGVVALEEGELSPEDIVALTAIASVGYQRNVIDDDAMNYYFGFDGSTPRYMDGLPPPGTVTVGPPAPVLAATE